MTLADLADETLRQQEFAVVAQKNFLAHASVAPLPRVAVDALIRHAQAAATAGPDEYGQALKHVQATRETCATLIGATPGEIALLGPTSLGLSLIANGLDWAPGDEVLYYADDYPANVYPWSNLALRGVVPRAFTTERRGEITPQAIEAALTPGTRLVALATANFVTGYRIDIDAIGQMLHARGILFSLDAIQTLGAFPLSVRHVDFLSADSHKWMLGPLAIGIVYVKEEHFGRLRPSLLGGENVRSPDFVAQSEIVFKDTAARYEPGVLNLGPLLAMKASLDLLLGFGLDTVAERIGVLRRRLAGGLQEMGFVSASPVDGPRASGILSVFHPTADVPALAGTLAQNRVTISLRRDRERRPHLRFSPHCYNMEAEIDQALAVLRKTLG
jgi:selenocysteine lyase/cysteine desulfurase